MIYSDLYLSCALISCFDGDPDAGNPDDTNPSGGNPGGNTGADDIKPPEGFTPEQQKKFNDAIAAERGKQERKYRKELEKAEASYQTLLASKNLTEQERRTLEENLSTVQGQLRTKEQQIAHEKKQLEEQYSGKLTDAEKRAQAWESRYRESTVARALQDAAVVNDAFRPEQIVTLLRPMTKLVEETDAAGRSTGHFRAMVEFPDVDATTGEPVPTTRTPEEAVKRMKELPEIYGNLFKSNVVSGIGSNSSTGGLPSGANGKVDLRKLAKNPEAFRKALKEQPEVLGLQRRR